MECKTVTLRLKPMKNGMLSYYLDFYPGIRDKETNKIHRHLSLGIYIYAHPTTKEQIQLNRNLAIKAEAIRCRRYEAIVNERYDFFEKSKLQGDFLAYFERACMSRNQKWYSVYLYFKQYMNDHCTFEDITVDTCRSFGEYLLNAPMLTKTGQLNQNSAASYFSTFRALLKIAYRDRMIRENVNDFLDQLETKEVRKEFLTLDELKVLAQTPCQYEVLKQASIFSCLTGLRISDILQLRWEDIEKFSDGGMGLRITSVKTGAEATLPISDEAMEYCGPVRTGLVFKGLKRSMTQKPLKEWVKSAGITKHITFHCFRHTFATIQVSLGTDIYTVSKLLLHKNVTTTQIYADLLGAPKREASNRISLK